jgi:hypothetical protein
MACRAVSDLSPSPCEAAQAEATVANGAGYTGWAIKSCSNLPCDIFGTTGRSYLFPYGGLPISPSVCDNNVWVSIRGASSFSPTWAQLADTNNWTERLLANFATPHYNVCESSRGAFTWSTL